MEKVRKLSWVRKRLIYKSLVANEYCVRNQLEFKRAFEFLDINKDGVITASDLMEISKLMGDEMPTEHDVNRWIKVFDMHQNHQITFEEFVATLVVRMENFMPESDIVRLFAKCDLQNQGYITIDNLIQVMAAQGKELTVEEARLMLREANLKSLPRIDFIEFKRIMKIMKKDILFYVGSILAT